MTLRSDLLSSTVRALPKNPVVIDQFNRHSLNIGFVSWEDTARDKNSVWGPNISDVSLDVDDKDFPIINTKNFNDPTCDMSINRFSLNVGNEKEHCETTMGRISFKEYLQNLGQYVAANVKGNFFLPRDDKILTSAQSCILPLNDNKVSFNVRIHNYQNDSKDPAVLVIVASPHGTSAQLLTDRKQKIYFNKCDYKAPYVAERLVDVRTAAGKPLEGPMTQEEKENNVLFIFQIPLKQKPQYHNRGGLCLDGCLSKGVVVDPTIAMIFAAKAGKEGTAWSIPLDGAAGDARFYESRGMDHAQLTVGDSIGPWNGTTPEFTIERDDRYPIRCTIQYYRVTDTDTISDETVNEISSQIWKFYDEAPITEKGSLVTNTATGRITEPQLPAKPSVPFFTF